MTIRPEFYIDYSEGDISVMRREPDGTERVVSPISASAAMAWDGFARGMSREALIDAIVNEFSGADRETVARDLDALAAQLVALGYAEEE